MRIKLIMFGAVVASAVITGCSSSSSGSPGDTGATSPAHASAGGQAFPVSVSAANGKVTIPSDPSRIVSLSPTATEDLYRVGAGKQVVAVDQTSNYPAGVPKTSLNGITPNIEAIAKYNPSLVVAAQDSNGLVKGLTKLGVPVLIDPAVTSLDAAYAQINQIGQATGHTAQAEIVVSGMKKEIAADVAKAGADHKDLSYFWEVSASPYYSATSKTFIGQVAGLFGLKNIADAADKASDGGYPQLSPEYIVAAKPQIIFLTDNEATDGGQTPAVVANRPGWSAIPAARDHEIIPLNDDVASRWGPRLPLLVAAIAQAVESAPKA
ncbi:MAG TPA: ABC transporter substrate-binding protein [Trebonia sp.]